MSAGFIEQGQYVNVTGIEPKLETDKQVTIDVSNYTAPVEITPTAGKDAMEKVTVALDDIPIPEHVVASDTWIDTTWANSLQFYGSQVWTDGENTYLSNGSDHYMFNETTNDWEVKTWNGLTNFYGSQVWSDGTDIYYSNAKYNSETGVYENEQYVLDKATSTWSVKTWPGSITDIQGWNVWTDHNNIYCTYGGMDTGNPTGVYGVLHSYKLNKTTGEWEQKVWNNAWDTTGYDRVYGNSIGHDIWKDYDGIIHYDGGLTTGAATEHMVLNKTTGEWEPKTWDNTNWQYVNTIAGRGIWTDESTIYNATDYMYDPSAPGGYTGYNLALNKDTGIWEPIDIPYFNQTKHIPFYGMWTWKDLKGNIYYNYNDTYNHRTCSAMLLWKKA